MSGWQAIIADLDEVDDADVHQRGTYRGMAGERYTRVMRLQPHGFSSVPPVGSRGVMLAGGAHRDVAMVLGMEHGDHRPRNQPAGSTVLYDHAGGILSIVDKNFRIVCADFTVEATGTITFKGTSVFDGEVALGGTGGKPVALKDSLDTNGDALIAALATKVTAV